MTPRILLVDDNPIQAATRRIILEKAGFHVTMAENGLKALDLLAAPSPFRLIITDHLMPEMNGPDLVREVRNRHMSIPVIVLSGLPDAETAYEGLDVLFRLKPFPPEELISTTREILPPLSRTA